MMGDLQIRGWQMEDTMETKAGQRDERVEARDAELAVGELRRGDDRRARPRVGR